MLVLLEYVHNSWKLRFNLEKKTKTPGFIIAISWTVKTIYGL